MSCGGPPRPLRVELGVVQRAVAHAFDLVVGVPARFRGLAQHPNSRAAVRDGDLMPVLRALCVRLHPTMSTVVAI